MELVRLVRLDVHTKEGQGKEEGEAGGEEGKNVKRIGNVTNAGPLGCPTH